MRRFPDNNLRKLINEVVTTIQKLIERGEDMDMDTYRAACKWNGNIYIIISLAFKVKQNIISIISIDIFLIATIKVYKNVLAYSFPCCLR